MSNQIYSPGHLYHDGVGIWIDDDLPERIEMHRPHYTHKDDNHGIILDFMRYACGGFEIHKDGRTVAYTANYHGHKFIAHDCANIGGVFADWLLECADTSRMCWIEIKTQAAYKAKDHSLKPGEVWLQDNSSLFTMVVTVAGIMAVFDDMLKP